jgi:flagellar hook-associated protein 3 FlgL
MAMRVATFANSDRMLAASLKTQARMAELQMQQASGNVSTDYGGLGRSTKPLLDLEASLKTSQAYASAASEAASRVEVMYSTLSSITDLLTEFRGQITSMMSADSSDASIQTLISAAEGFRDELASLLNTTFEGRYLFSGDATTTAPVDLSGYGADADTASTDYYRGNDGVTRVKIARDQTVAYGVTADNPAFEQAFRALSIIADAGTVDTDLLQSSYDLIVTALDDTIAVQSKLSINASTLERSIERQSDYETYLSAMISELKDADVTKITVALTSYETQLQASYSAIAKVQSLNLLDYLR